MKTTVERVDSVTVKLSVEVEPERVKRAFDEAAKHIGKDVELPGFRKGKAPRKLLEARLGKDAIAQHAMQDALSDFYLEAVRSEELQPVAQPELDVETWDETEGARFEATVEVRPDFEVPDYQGLSVTMPDWEVDHQQVESHIEQLRDRFSELEEVDRPAGEGDYVTLDLEVRVGGETLESGEVEDALYEIGSGGVTPKLDSELIGVEGGAEFSYVDNLPEGYPEHGGEEAEFLVTVKDVRAKQLPDLDDDFAASASEFDTMDELREDVRRSLLRRSVSEAQHQLRARVVEAYVANVDIPLPPKMLEQESQGRLEQLEQQAQQYGMELDDLLEAQGKTRDEIESEAQEWAADTVKTTLVLDALAEQLDLDVSAEEVEQEVVRHAQQRGVDPRQLAEAIQQQGQLGVLIGDILRRKTIDTLLDAAEVEGAPDHDLLVELGLAEDEGTAEEEADSGQQTRRLEVASGAADVKRALEESG